MLNDRETVLSYVDTANVLLRDLEERGYIYVYALTV
jgi:hypothetical protein